LYTKELLVERGREGSEEGRQRRGGPNNTASRFLRDLQYGSTRCQQLYSHSRVAYTKFQHPLTLDSRMHDHLTICCRYCEKMLMLMFVLIKFQDSTQVAMVSYDYIMHILFKAKLYSNPGLFEKSLERIYCCFSNKMALTEYKAKTNPPEKLP